MKKFLIKYHRVILILILSFAFITRAFRVHLPEIYIFDEVYHAVTAKLIARNDPWAYEWNNPPVEPNTAVDWLHPPYAKYTQAFFILLFGENTFGWRISSVLFGLLVIVMVYKLSFELFENKNLSLMATLLASFDGLLLVQSRIAMNDIHVTFFILLAFFFYIKYKKQTKFMYLVLAAIGAGLAMGTKWSGLFALVTIVFFEIITAFKNLDYKIKPSLFLKNTISFIFVLIILPSMLYLASYTHMFLQGKSLFCFENKPIDNICYRERLKFGPWIFDGYLSHFGELHRQIWWYQTGLTATHGYQSRPWQWFLNLRPVWFHVAYQKGSLTNIYSQGNTTLFWAGDMAVIASVLVLIISTSAKLIRIFIHKSKIRLKTTAIKAIKELSNFQLPKYFSFLVFAYFIVWLPWQISPRIMFFYHYTPAVPLLSIILAYWLSKLAGYQLQKIQIGKIIVLAVIILCAANFILFYPNWTGITVPSKIFQPLYFALKSWK